MGQISMEIFGRTGSTLSGNQQLKGIETLRAIRKAEFDEATKGVANEITFVQNLIKLAARNHKRRNLATRTS